MNKIRHIKLGLIVIVFILGWQILGFSQSNETFTITTYYPSPSGIYREVTIYGKTTFKDSDATPQDVELSTDGAGNLVFTVANNPPANPAQLYFNDSGTINPFCYLQAFNSGLPTDCVDGYLKVNYLESDKTPADPGSLPSSGYYVCLRGWD